MAEILAELNYIEAVPVFVGDQAPPLPALLVPVAAGIGEELVRLSVGIETAQDIIDDLGQALRASQRV